MNARTARKQVLIAESELNRAHFIEECASFTAGLRQMGDRTRPIQSAVSSVALVVTGLAAFQRGLRKPKTHAGKTVWMGNLLKGAGVISSIWLALQAPRRER